MELPTNYDKLNSRSRRKVREQYVLRQHGRCMYCNERLDTKPPKEITDKPIDLGLYPPNFLGSPVHLQHNHTTGMTEGAVHAYCNAVLWEYEYR